jgi:hypothetical protein
VHNRNISAVKKVEFVSHRSLGHIFVLNVNKIGDVKDSFNEELEYVFDKFPK